MSLKSEESFLSLQNYIISCGTLIIFSTTREKPQQGKKNSEAWHSKTHLISTFTDSFKACKKDLASYQVPRPKSMHWIISINFTSVHDALLCPWQIQTIYIKTIAYLKIFLFLTEHFLSSTARAQAKNWNHNPLSGKTSLHGYMPCVFSHTVVESNFLSLCFFFYQKTVFLQAKSTLED